MAVAVGKRFATASAGPINYRPRAARALCPDMLSRSLAMPPRPLCHKGSEKQRSNQNSLPLRRVLFEVILSCSSWAFGSTGPFCRPAERKTQNSKSYGDLQKRGTCLASLTRRNYSQRGRPTPRAGTTMFGKASNFLTKLLIYGRLRPTAAKGSREDTAVGLPPPFVPTASLVCLASSQGTRPSPREATGLPFRFAYSLPSCDV